MKKLLFFILLFFIAAALTSAYLIFCTRLTTADGENSHLIYIYPDTHTDTLLNTLHTEFHASPIALKLNAKLLKLNHPKTGCYQLCNRQTILSALRTIRAAQQTPVNITFNNIRTKQQLADRLAQQLLLSDQELLALLNDNTFLSQFSLNTETAVCIFIPDTYEVYWTISPQQLFTLMNEHYCRFWNSRRTQQAQDLQLSKTDIATIASIAEEETNRQEEYPIIAGLYINRLRRHMPLQACPTIKFAWQDFSLRRILNRHLEIDSPYNTYRNQGLPPGPIRLPRATTIDAVLNYTPSDYLFMCASADFNGTHHFSATYAEHAQYAKQYQTALNKRNIK